MELKLFCKHISKCWGFWILLFSCRLASAQIQQSPNGFHPLAHVSATDWVSYSVDGGKVAIVRALSSGGPSVGKSVEVYSVGADLQPHDLLWRDEQKNSFITELEWVGETLFYPTVEGFTSLDSFYQWAAEAVKHGGPAKLADHFRLRTWPVAVQQAGDLPSLHLEPPGHLFAESNGKNLIVFDAIEDMAKLWNNQTQQFDDANYSQRFVRIYQVPEGKLIKSTTLKLPFTGGRRWGNSGDWVPLFTSEDRKYLVAVVARSSPWKQPTAYSGPYLITIDLQSGNIKALNSEAEGHGLGGLGGSLTYFRPGYPFSVEGGKAVVCRLDTSLASQTMIFRFGFYALNGEKLKEVLIYDHDLKRAGLPPIGLFVGWTPEGTKALMQVNGDVWLFDWQSGKGRRIAQSIKIENVIGWVKGRYLLVRARKVVGSTTPDPANQIKQEPIYSDVSDWGVLSIPDLEDVDLERN